jgi:mannose-6-phosphate isomerase-like protein (cupin superfamily)
MDTSKMNAQEGTFFSAAHLGAFSELDQYQFFHPKGKGKGFPGKVFLKTPLSLTSMEVSVNKLPAGQEMPFHHRHKQHEELYIFVRGNGQFQVDGQIIDIREGSVVRVAPEGARTWRNNSQEDLYYLVIQAKDGSLDANDIEDGEMLPQKVVWPE